MIDNSEQIQRVEKRVSSPNDKTKLRYWRRRIFKPSYIRDGVKMQSPIFCAEIQHKGKRVRWSLGPANPEAAATRARELYLYLVAKYWKATLAIYRPTTLAQADPTIGAFIEAVRATADLNPRTLKGYVNSLRK